jgi:aminopeptidase-like protein
MPFLFQAMTVASPSFRRYGEKLSAFTADNRLVMSFGSPMVNVPVSIKELQEFICSLEQAIDDEPSIGQRFAFLSMKSIFEAALKQAQRDYDEMVSEAPTGADLEEYMLAYARAVQKGAV